MDHFIAVLGQPAVVTHIDAIEAESGDIAHTDLDRQVFLQTDFIVAVLSNGQGEVQQYTVLSCDPTFRPTFHTPTGSTVRLNEAVLDQADTSDTAPSTSGINPDRVSRRSIVSLNLLREPRQAG